jgi:hypothetical protein
VSTDGGKTWSEVDELVMEDKPSGKVFSWTLWKFKLDTSKIQGKISIRVRAIDSKGDFQDGDLANLYNLRGILNNAPHEINFIVNSAE